MADSTALPTALYSDINEVDPTLLANRFLINSSSVLQAFFNLLNTKPGERLFKIQFGVDLETMLFKAVTPDNARLILKMVFDATRNFESRVILVYNQCSVVPLLTNDGYTAVFAGRVQGAQASLPGASFTFTGTLPAGAAVTP